MPAFGNPSLFLPVAKLTCMAQQVLPLPGTVLHSPCPAPLTHVIHFIMDFVDFLPGFCEICTCTGDVHSNVINTLAIPNVSRGIIGLRMPFSTSFISEHKSLARALELTEFV